jgi:hypothetical protein
MPKAFLIENGAKPLRFEASLGTATLAVQKIIQISH